MLYTYRDIGYLMNTENLSLYSDYEGYLYRLVWEDYDYVYNLSFQDMVDRYIDDGYSNVWGHNSFLAYSISGHYPIYGLRSETCPSYTTKYHSAGVWCSSTRIVSSAYASWYSLWYRSTPGSELRILVDGDIEYSSSSPNPFSWEAVDIPIPVGTHRVTIQHYIKEEGSSSERVSILTTVAGPVFNFLSPGSGITKIFEGLNINRLAVMWDEEKPDGTDVKVYVRHGNSNTTLGNWVEIDNGILYTPSSTFNAFQIRVEMSSSVGNTPSIKLKQIYARFNYPFSPFTGLIKKKNVEELRDAMKLVIKTYGSSTKINRTTKAYKDNVSVKDFTEIINGLSRILQTEFDKEWTHTIEPGSISVSDFEIVRDKIMETLTRSPLLPSIFTGSVSHPKEPILTTNFDSNNLILRVKQQDANNNYILDSIPIKYRFSWDRSLSSNVGRYDLELKYSNTLKIFSDVSDTFVDDGLHQDEDYPVTVEGKLLVFDKNGNSESMETSLVVEGTNVVDHFEVDYSIHNHRTTDYDWRSLGVFYPVDFSTQDSGVNYSFPLPVSVPSYPNEIRYRSRLVDKTGKPFSGTISEPAMINNYITPTGTRLNSAITNWDGYWYTAYKYPFQLDSEYQNVSYIEIYCGISDGPGLGVRHRLLAAPYYTLESKYYVDTGLSFTVNEYEEILLTGYITPQTIKMLYFQPDTEYWYNYSYGWQNTIYDPYWNKHSSVNIGFFDPTIIRPYRFLCG